MVSVINSLQLRYRYHTYEIGQFDIHIRSLRDRQQFYDPNNLAKSYGITSAHWSFFGVVWDSSQLLANLMLDYDLDQKKILEIGCGIGLASILLNERGADISATDYHPDVEHFLNTNIELNNGKYIPFTRAAWSDDENQLGRFDVLIGSDLLYDISHIDELALFISRHSNPLCEIIIVDPGRFLHSRFNRKMKELGFNCHQSKTRNTPYLKKPFLGRVLYYNRDQT